MSKGESLGHARGHGDQRRGRFARRFRRGAGRAATAKAKPETGAVDQPERTQTRAAAHARAARPQRRASAVPVAHRPLLPSPRRRSHGRPKGVIGRSVASALSRVGTSPHGRMGKLARQLDAHARVRRWSAPIPQCWQAHAGDSWFAQSPAGGGGLRADSTAEVSAVLKYAARHGMPVTPRGAGFGYVGGCVPMRGGIALSVARMNAHQGDQFRGWRGGGGAGGDHRACCRRKRAGRGSSIRPIRRA